MRKQMSANRVGRTPDIASTRSVRRNMCFPGKSDAKLFGLFIQESRTKVEDYCMARSWKLHRNRDDKEVWL